MKREVAQECVDTISRILGKKVPGPMEFEDEAAAMVARTSVG
jgi:hypothetical protein